MKTLLITASLIATLFVNALAETPASVTPAPAAAHREPGMYTLTVTLANVTQRTGKIYISVSNSDATFAGGGYRKTRVEVPATGEVSINFEGMPAGTYAIRVFQDLNENQKIDFNGPMPTEPFGFSNLPMLIGPPSFKQCAFELADNKQIAISLSNL